MYRWKLHDCAVPETPFWSQLTSSSNHMGCMHACLETLSQNYAPDPVHIPFFQLSQHLDDGVFQRKSDPKSMFCFCRYPSSFPFHSERDIKLRDDDVRLYKCLLRVEEELIGGKACWGFAPL